MKNFRRLIRILAQGRRQSREIFHFQIIKIALFHKSCWHRVMIFFQNKMHILVFQGCTNTTKKISAKNLIYTRIYILMKYWCFVKKITICSKTVKSWLFCLVIYDFKSSWRRISVIPSGFDNYIERPFKRKKIELKIFSPNKVTEDRNWRIWRKFHRTKKIPSQFQCYFLNRFFEKLAFFE